MKFLETFSLRIIADCIAVTFYCVLFTFLSVMYDILDIAHSTWYSNKPAKVDLM